MTILGYIFGIILAFFFGYMLGAENPSKNTVKMLLKDQEIICDHLKQELSKYKTAYINLIKIIKNKNI